MLQCLTFFFIGFQFCFCFDLSTLNSVARFGSRQAATSYNGAGTDPAEDNSVWEAYYTFKVNDGVTVTPAVFGGSDVEAEGKDVNGAVVLTEFKF